MSASWTACQNGSNSSKPNDREPPQPRDRGGADEDRAGAPLDHPLELLDRLLDDGEGDDRRGEDAVLVVERPRLVHPLVEGVDHRVDELRVVAHPLLEQAGERREHEGPVDAELVHQLDAGRGLAEGGDALHRLTDDLAIRLALRVADAEVLLLGPRSGHDLEGRVRDVLADLAPHHDLGPAPDLHVVDGPLVAVREVAGERILRLVQVVVGVEDGELAHTGHGCHPTPSLLDPDQLQAP